MPSASLRLALADAARNCASADARATITLKSGIQYTGRLKPESGADLGTRHMHLPGGGWVTFAIDELAAVESRH